MEQHILKFFLWFFYAVIILLAFFLVVAAMDEGKSYIIYIFAISALLIRGGIAGISLGVAKDTNALEKYVGTSNATASIIIGCIAGIIGIIGVFWTISDLFS